MYAKYQGVTGIPLTALPVICLANSNTPFHNKEKTKANSIATSIAFISDNFWAVLDIFLFDAIQILKYQQQQKKVRQ